MDYGTKTTLAANVLPSSLDALQHLMFLLDECGHVLRASQSLEASIPGVSKLVMGLHVHDMLHPGCSNWKCDLKAKWEEMWQHMVAEEFEASELHDQTLGRDLSFSLCKGGTSKYEDNIGNQVYAFLVIRDISQHKRAERILEECNIELEGRLQECMLQITSANAKLEDEVQEHLRDKEELRETAKKYTCIMENSLTGFYVIQEERIVFCNSRFAALFGYTQEEMYHLDLQQLFPFDKCGDITASSGGMEWMEKNGAVKGITRDGRTLWLHRSLTRIDCLSEAMTLGNVIDISAQRTAEDALECLQCEKRILSEKLLISDELKRKQIASDLHDSIGQSISAIKFGLENALRNYGEILPESGRGSLIGLVGKLCDTIEEVRNISMDLRPPMLDDLGLLATTSWFCREFNALFPGLHMDVRTDVEESEIPDTLKVVIFRILQEALNNIGKHAMATRVSIELARKGDTVTIEIQDDGRGFEAEEISTGNGFGLGSMRERAKLSGGNLAIESRPGAGTLLRASWPAGQ